MIVLHSLSSPGRHRQQQCFPRKNNIRRNTKKRQVERHARHRFATSCSLDGLASPSRPGHLRSELVRVADKRKRKYRRSGKVKFSRQNCPRLLPGITCEPFCSAARPQTHPVTGTCTHTPSRTHTRRGQLLKCTHAFRGSIDPLFRLSGGFFAHLRTLRTFCEHQPERSSKLCAQSCKQTEQKTKIRSIRTAFPAPTRTLSHTTHAHRTPTNRHSYPQRPI